MRLGPAACAAVALLLVAGCGADEDESEAPGPLETVDRVPDLPRQWRPHVNRAGGFAFGLPSGWKAADRDDRSTLVRSRDRLLAVSIVADRTAEALGGPLEEFATRALVALPGFSEQLEPGAPRAVRHRYAAVGAKARGSAASGVDQRLLLIVLRREDVVTITALIAANQRRSSARSEALAEELVRTLRSRPVAPPAGS